MAFCGSAQALTDCNQVLVGAHLRLLFQVRMVIGRINFVAAVELTASLLKASRKMSLSSAMASVSFFKELT